MRALTGMAVRDLESLLGSRARALAAARWIYGPRPWTTVVPPAIPGVGRATWERVRDACVLPDARVARSEVAADGTIKLLVALGERAVETVLIPARGRSTVCVSSQVGCTRHCTFCATASLGFSRNLRAEEILAQYLIARTLAPEAAPARNVVFMGMGEPLDNLDEVLAAVELLTQAPMPQLGFAQVTVSTSGILPAMKRFLVECRASLALSLNASTDAQRTALMPQNKLWPIAALMDLLREHPDRVHFIEYVMFDGVNDALEDAARVVELLAGVNARVNLIPHNPIAGSSLRSSPVERVHAFHHQLSAACIRCIVRWPRGQDIAAACGQLASR